MNNRGVGIYFINYKNSVLGTGGVGTVSRDMIKYNPDIHFVYWDGSKADRDIDLGIKTPRELHKIVHIKYAKAYLWPVLHGLPSKINPDKLTHVRQKVLVLVELIAKKIYKFASDKSQQESDRIYWINDYTSIALIGKLRKLDKNSTIIFTFRTPFGVKNQYPKFYDDDILLLKGLLQSDCITFHRQNDLEHFIKFIDDKFHKEISRINSKKNNATVTLKNDKHITLSVAPMGNNKSYRKGILHNNSTRLFYKNIKSYHQDNVMITGISRFEESKGIEYEIDCINTLLQTHPELSGKFVFLRYSYMSEDKIQSKEYNAFMDKVITKITIINNKYGTDKWKPIVYDFNKKLTDYEVAGLLMASDILIIASHADGFNHLALEAIYSQKRTGAIQLLLSDIGVTDYIHGYKKLSHNIEDDVKILYESIKSKGIRNWFTQQRLNSSANKLSSRRWMTQIIKLANNIRERK